MVIGAGEVTVSKHRPVIISDANTDPHRSVDLSRGLGVRRLVPFRRATEIVEVMQRLIGRSPTRARACAVTTRFGGMENSSAIFYAEKPYVERRMGEGVVRHETRRQWFGDAVTERDWPTSGSPKARHVFRWGHRSWPRRGLDSSKAYAHQTPKDISPPP